MSKLSCGVWLVTALALSACTVPKSHPYELDEALIGAPGVQTVGLLPLNVLLALPQELDGGSRRVAAAIRSHLGECGKQLVHFSMGEARSLWTEVAGEEADDAAFEANLATYVQRLREKRAFDVLIVPSLVFRDGRIRSVTHQVDWDGVKRVLEIKGHTHMSGSLYMTGDVTGKMPAVSLHLAILNADGVRVFDSYGGLDLIHQVQFGTVYRYDLNDRHPVATMEFNLKRKRLRDEANIAEGVALAFTPYMDPPTADVPTGAEAP